MISVYKNANKERKQYKVKGVKVGSTKNGGAFTTFRINDNKQDATTKAWNSTSYTVFVWEKLGIIDGDSIEFNEIQSIECCEKEYNGEKRFERTIFASVKPIPANPQVHLEEVDTVSTPFDKTSQGSMFNSEDDEDNLPF